MYLHPKPKVVKRKSLAFGGNFSRHRPETSQSLREDRPAPVPLGRRAGKVPALNYPTAARSTGSGWPRLVALLPVAGGINAVHQGNQGEEHRDDDAADDYGEDHDHDRFQQGGHGRHGIVHFLIIVVRDFQ